MENTNQKIGQNGKTIDTNAMMRSVQKIEQIFGVDIKDLCILAEEAGATIWHGTDSLTIVHSEDDFESTILVNKDGNIVVSDENGMRIGNLLYLLDHYESLQGEVLTKPELVYEISFYVEELTTEERDFIEVHMDELVQELRRLQTTKEEFADYFQNELEKYDEYLAIEDDEYDE